MSINKNGDYPQVILLGHGNIGNAFAKALMTKQNSRVFAIFGTGGGILIPNDETLNRFLDTPRGLQKASLNIDINPIQLAIKLGSERTLVVDASSNPDPNAHTELFQKGFRIVSANKNPVGLGKPDIAMQMLNSPRYGAEPTVMAGQGVLNFIGSERINPNSQGPIESITQIDLIGSGTLSGIAEDLAKGITYSAAVNNAIKRGDTEPNPNDDMDGEDLAKKLVILARKAGYDKTIKDVKFGDGFLGKEFRTEFEGRDWGTKDIETDTQREFIQKIQKEKDQYMKELIETNRPKVPRYIGRMIRNTDGTVDLSVGIEFVPVDSEHCAAKYNKIIMTVDRGEHSPVDIRTLSGRGAGPVQTADGLIKQFNQVRATL